MAGMKTLFTPGRIGKLEIKNRILQAPMGTFSYGVDGVPTPQTIDYFVERAKGGVGLIICQAVRVSPECRVVGFANLYEDKYIPIMARIADAVHAAGAKVALQINHSGMVLTYRNAGDEVPADSYAVGPSPFMHFKTGIPARELAKQDIRRLVECFSDTARRVMQAGFDMVEIHGAHGYLVSSFLSPFTNRRTDEYGRSPENRARFLSEILQRIRDKAGRDFPVSVRFSGADFLPGGTTVEDSLIQAPLFEKAAATMLHVSAGGTDNFEVVFLSYLYPDAFLVDLAAAIKKVVNIPVCAVGKLGIPQSPTGSLKKEKPILSPLADRF